MERAADQQTAAMTEHLRRELTDLDVPDGLDQAQTARIFQEAGRRAMFDSSQEATLARKYEAAAERSFFRCLKELDKMDRSAKAQAKADAELNAEMMGPFFQSDYAAMMDERELAALAAKMGVPLPSRSPIPPRPAGHDGRIDMSITPKRPG